jgi:hypothetical protein
MKSRFYTIFRPCHGMTLTHGNEVQMKLGEERTLETIPLSDFGHSIQPESRYRPRNNDFGFLMHNRVRGDIWVTSHSIVATVRSTKL